jgi:hypothetical protein
MMASIKGVWQVWKPALLSLSSTIAVSYQFSSGLFFHPTCHSERRRNAEGVASKRGISRGNKHNC